MARRNAAELVSGAGVLLLAAGFLGYAIAHSGRTDVSGYTLRAQFEHIDGLEVGAAVRIAGVKVGSVTAETIDPKTYLAEVSMDIARDIKLPKDTSAAINSESLLGGKYIGLSPGGDSAMLQPGQTITITQGSISLEQLLGKFIFSASSLATSMKPAAGPNAGGNGGPVPAAGQQGAQPQ
jgi:phospholipid/cholesterol/gamma-HCH transport system substrate-binding protein